MNDTFDSSAEARVRIGLELLLSEQLDLISGSPLGLVTNPSGVDRQLRSTAELLETAPEVDLRALFTPEHGFWGAAAAGRPIPHSTHPVLGLPIYSLYGAEQKLWREALSELDLIVVDLQDVGARYFTYAAALLDVMKATEGGTHTVVVLDRPNPLSGTQVEGPVLEAGMRSLVGCCEVPVRHGLTLGELGLVMQSEYRRSDGTVGLDTELRVVPMRGWRRALWYDETGLTWVPPSPNMPTLAAAVVYPGTCLLEGTNISEGRGTPLPFQLIGTPWIDGVQLAERMRERSLPGVMFRPVAFHPTASKYAGKACGGVQLHVCDRQLFQPVRTGLELVNAVRRLWPEQFEWKLNEDGRYTFDYLVGTTRIRHELEAGRAPLQIAGDWVEQHRVFETEREPYLLYGEEVD